MRILSLCFVAFLLVSCAKARSSLPSEKPVVEVQPSFVVPANATVTDYRCVTNAVFTVNRGPIQDEQQTILGVTRSWLSEDSVIANVLDETIDGLSKVYTRSLTQEKGQGVYLVNISSEEWKKAAGLWNKRVDGIERLLKVNALADGVQETQVLSNRMNGVDVSYNWKFVKTALTGTSYKIFKENIKPTELNRDGREYLVYQTTCYYNPR